MRSQGLGPESSFEMYRDQVYAWAYRMLGNDQDSQDVVQNVFLKWDQQCRTQLPTQPRGWLRRVTLNCATDVCRKRQRMPDSLTDSACDDAAYEPTPGHAADQAVLRRDVALALDRLTDVQRSVVVAKVYDGLTFADIAAEHDIATSTAKTHYLRGIRSLFEQLRGRWSESADGMSRPAERMGMTT